MSIENESILAMIRGLYGKTTDKGCTEAESILAARKVGELLQKYNLSMDEVFIEKLSCITATIETGKQNRQPIDNCVSMICDFCDCKVWRSWKCYKIFGTEADTTMAKYLYSIVENALICETMNYKRTMDYVNCGTTNRRTLSNSFQVGMVSRIHARLRDMMNDRKREENATAGHNAAGTSLVVVKSNKVIAEYKKLGMKLKSATRSRRSYNFHAFEAGKNAGNSVNLSRPIESRNNNLTIGVS
jgi:hypothetical protein